MACAARRLLRCSALLLDCAIVGSWGSPCAGSDLNLISSDSFQLSGDVRLVAIDGESSWLRHGLGKFRSGSDGTLRAAPQLGNANLVWQPQFTWSLSATIVGSLQGGTRTQAGLSQAYFAFRPMRSSEALSWSARAGLMWPPVSLEHEGPDWHVAESITPSAINSWIGEEVRPLSLEGTLSASAAGQKLRATAAVFAANDTSGTLLTFRGWALHDRTTLAFNRWPLPPLEGAMGVIQAPFTHPLIDLHSGFARHQGYYAKIVWQPQLPLRLELFHYDNQADPRDVNADREWGWRTEFDDLGLLASCAGLDLKAQALEGRTRMGFSMNGRHWVDNRFRSLFVLAGKSFGKVRISARAEAFGTHNQGSIVGEDYDESGWSSMIAVKRDWRYWTGLVELLHVSSRRNDREDLGLDPRQRQTQFQAEMRMHW